MDMPTRSAEHFSKLSVRIYDEIIIVKLFVCMTQVFFVIGTSLPAQSSHSPREVVVSTKTTVKSYKSTSPPTLVTSNHSCSLHYTQLSLSSSLSGQILQANATSKVRIKCQFEKNHLDIGIWIKHILLTSHSQLLRQELNEVFVCRPLHVKDHVNVLHQSCCS